MGQTNANRKRNAEPIDDHHRGRNPVPPTGEEAIFQRLCEGTVIGSKPWRMILGRLLGEVENAYYRSVYSFPVAATTSCHKHSALKQNVFITSQFYRREVCCFLNSPFPKARFRVFPGLRAFLEFLRMNPFPNSLKLLATCSSLWLFDWRLCFPPASWPGTSLSSLFNV